MLLALIKTNILRSSSLLGSSAPMVLIPVIIINAVSIPLFIALLVAYFMSARKVGLPLWISTSTREKPWTLIRYLKASQILSSAIEQSAKRRRKHHGHNGFHIGHVSTDAVNERDQRLRPGVRAKLEIASEKK
ncbi:hypothetical protein Y032_0078g1177 [Ancylostoma ceylanicum]|uniref:Uncharacterized protein n=1 Tax=Ancylostoma ceylanicum TaxID=53326 RepID=A0A016TUM9_9BILA|nr:hypothetical protein Y032_0078g1177 [Ancylostoma ceylanicum]